MAAEACAETAFSYSVEVDEGSGLADLISDAETLRGQWQGAGDRHVFVALQRLNGSDPSPAPPTLVTIAENGEARHTVHIPDGPLAITYLGTCEGPSD